VPGVAAGHAALPGPLGPAGRNVVDGAPATRFGGKLRELVESATAISPLN